MQALYKSKPLAIAIVAKTESGNTLTGYYNADAQDNGVVMTDIKKIQPELEVISRAAEAMEKNADQLLRNADEIAYLPERMNKRFEKKRETLLRNIPDTQVRKEVYKILELDK